MNQFLEGSITDKCRNPYCIKGEDGGRKTVAIRNSREGGGYCSKSCESINRYKKRYTGSLNGRATQNMLREKMSQL